MVEPDTSFIQHAGYVLFPRRPDDLTSTSNCPACFTALNGTVCSNCQLDLTHPAAAQLHDVSLQAAANIEQRLAIIGRIRFETAQAPAPVAATAAAAAPSAAVVGAPIPGPVAPTPAPAVPVADAAPRRHLGVQVILLIVGVSLLAIGAIFFLIYAFITFGLVWRSVIIGTVTVAAIVGATLLRRRKLGATAESIAALGVVFVYLDTFAIRANDLFGLGDSDALVYWGTALLVTSVGFIVWHRLSGLRLPSLVGFAALPVGLALLIAGLTEPLDDQVRVFGAFIGLAVGALVHPLAGRRGADAAAPVSPASDAPAPASTTPGRLERAILLSLALLGLVGAGFAALVIDPANDWAPAVAFGIVALVALVHVVVVVLVGSPRPLGLAIAGFGAVAASGAMLAVALRVEDVEFAAIAPLSAAAVVALVLEFVARRLVAPLAKSAAVVAAWSAAVVAGVIMVVPLWVSVTNALLVASSGARRWSVPGSETISLRPEHLTAVIALGIVVVLAALAWSIGGTLAARRAALVSGVFAVLILAVPLLGVLWAVVAVWLLLAAVGVTLLIVGRAWGAAIRVPLAIGTVAATTLGYASSWASIDTWWYGSIGAVVLLVVARFATAQVPVRAILTGVASVIALVATGAEGFHLNERFSTGVGAAVEATHFVAILAIVLLALSAVLAARLLPAIETRVLFWISFVTAAGAAGVSWAFTTTGTAENIATLVLPEFATSLTLGAGLFAALLLWVLLRSTAVFRPERIVASIAIAPAVAWIVDSFTRLLRLSEFLTSVAPITASIIVAAGALAITLLRPSGTPRWAREVGVGLVAVPALLTAAARPSDSTWLVLVLGGVTALLLAVSKDGLFASSSPRKHLGWVALALVTGGLWWRLGDDRVRDLEPYVLPLAGALLVIALLSWRATRKADPPGGDDTGSNGAAPYITLAGLLVAILPIAGSSVNGDVTRTIVIFAVSAALLLLGSFVTGTAALRPYLDVAAIAGAAGVVTAGLGRPLIMAMNQERDDTTLDLWLAATFIVLTLAALGQARIRSEATAPARAIASQALVGLAMAGIAFIELPVLDDTALSTVRAMAVLLLFCAIHVVGLLVNKPPFTALIGWAGIGLAAVTWVVGLRLEVIDPLEWGTGAIALALLIVGAVTLRRNPAARSWPWLAPGILVLLLPSLVATFTDQPVWRLVGLGVACIALVIIGALMKLQAPLILGAVIVLVHGIRTFAPQLVAVYQLTEWWVWAVVGGAIILFLGFTYEKRLRDVRNVSTRVASLR